jgi:hypothetical protein
LKYQRWRLALPSLVAFSLGLKLTFSQGLARPVWTIFEFIRFTEDFLGATVDLELNRKDRLDVTPVEADEFSSSAAKTSTSRLATAPL